MLDQVLGRPSKGLRRIQIFLVLFFWIWRLYKGDGASRPLDVIAGPSRPIKSRPFFWRLWVSLVGRRAIRWMSKMNDRLKRFTPSQLVLATLTMVYAIRHLDDLLGTGPPEPLARLYSRSYYRATYVNTAFDAGFASAMAIRPKWARDLASFLFSVYYLVWAREGDEVLRRFRALCTVEMLRTTWEKTNNPYLRLITVLHRPSIPIFRQVTIIRPPSSSRASLPPVKALLFFNGTEDQLRKATEIVVDFPGGGFVAMGPECHEERLRRWARRMNKPVLGVNYGKAPEYPYPWAIEEGFDAYRTLMETKGRCIGIRSNQLSVVLTGDSAGANICTTIMLRIIEHHSSIPRPTSMVLAYPALDFNFTSWMSPSNLRVLRTEQSEAHIPGLIHGKDHMRHKSPLSVVDDVSVKRPEARRQTSGWSQSVMSRLPSLSASMTSSASPHITQSAPTSPAAPSRQSLPGRIASTVTGLLSPTVATDRPLLEGGLSSSEESADSGDDTETEDLRRPSDTRKDQDKSLRERVKTPKEERRFDLPPVSSSPPQTLTGEQSTPTERPKRRKRAPLGTRLTMTSRVGYFQDRIISPTMMRAMAILYIGPQRNPDFETDYYISPILAPAELLAHFPPMYLICGERDPFVDDTIIFAGKVREAKRRRRAQAESSAQSKSAKFGETLRMSSSRIERARYDPILEETDDDWVQMRIIEGWGHGFMQMATLMKEVDSVLHEMADWIDESFVKAGERRKEATRGHPTVRLPPPTPTNITSGPLSPTASTLVKPARTYKAAPEDKALGIADLGEPVLGRGGNVEEDGVLAFTPKSKRKGPPASGFRPVPRVASHGSDLHRSSSAPRFDFDDHVSSGETVRIQTPALSINTLSDDFTPKGSGSIAFFEPARPHSSSVSKAADDSSATSTYNGGLAPRRVSVSAGSSIAIKPSNHLVAAALAGARVASPALAAAGFVPEKVGDISEAELMRRRRTDAVYGMSQAESPNQSDDEDDYETYGPHA